MDHINLIRNIDVVLDVVDALEVGEEDLERQQRRQ